MAPKSNILAAFLLVGLILFAASFNPTQAQDDIAFVGQGPCSALKDCNQHCLDSGFSLGGKCMPDPDKGTNDCYCSYQ